MVVYRKEPSKVENQAGTTATHIENLNSSDEVEKCVASPPPMVSRAILTCRPNSHPFQERTLALDQPVKIGRSVARCRPAPNNAIFDCKVLSRNHALLWYDNGKFFLQDTKSSNGTFVNNQRLSKGSEESPAREVCSGDIVQFGVDVVENSRKVTHGCIVATLKLFLPDGKEAKASPSTAVIPSSPGTTISTQDLYQLSQYLQEALHREQILQNKIATLQRVMSSTQEATDTGWKAMIEEDRLLNRIETLESQLQAFSKNATEDKLKDELTRLQEEKDKYQDTAKESLRKVLQEKLEAVRKVQDLEYNLNSAEEECTRLRELYESTQKELHLLADKNDEHQKELSEMLKQLKDAELKQEEMCNKASEEKHALEEKIEELKKEEQVLSAKIESLQADNDFAKEQLAAMKARFEHVKKTQYIEDSFGLNGSLTNQVDSQEVDKESGQTITGTLIKNEDDVEKLKDDIKLSEKETQEKNKLMELNSQLNNLKQEEIKQTTLSKELQAKVCELEELEQIKAEKDEITVKEAYIKSDDEKETDGEKQSNGDASSEKMEQLQHEISILKELLHESRLKKEKAEQEIAKLKDQLEKAKTSAEESAGEANTVQEQLLVAKKQAKDQVDQIIELQDKLTKSESSLNEVKEQLLILKARLAEEEQRNKLKQEEVNSLQTLLEEEKRAHQKLESVCETIKKQLQEAQNNAKQNLNESEHLRKKLRGLQEELRNRANADKSGTGDKNRGVVCSREECANLRAKIQSVEAETKKYHNENAKLMADYKRLQESYAELEKLKLALENCSGEYWPEQLEKSRQEAEKVREQLQQANEEIVQLKESYSACSEERARLDKELKSVLDDYSLVSYQSKTISACSIIPLCVLLLAVLLGFYPTISFLTATTEPS